MSELGRLVTELQVHGVAEASVAGNPGRRGGAGPSDHRALTIDGTTVMVPVYNTIAQDSPYRLQSDGGGVALADRHGTPLIAVQATADETVAFSWVEWPDKATRDAGMKKMMEDPRMDPSTPGNPPMPFDGKRMIFGGFVPVLEVAQRGDR